MTNSEVEQILQGLPEEQRAIISKNLKKKRRPLKKPKHKKVPYVERSVINSAISKIEVLEHRVLLSLLYLCAGRIGEVLELRKENFRFDMRKNFLTIKDMKNLKNPDMDKKTLAIPRTDSLVPSVKDYVESLPKEGYLFPRRYMAFGWEYRVDYHKLHMSGRNALRVVKQSITDPRLGRVVTHTSRHFRLSSLAVDDGLSSWQLRGVSGHKSAVSLGSYVESDPFKIGSLISPG